MSELLRFDPSGVFLAETGLRRAEVAELGPQLERLRDEVCDIDVKMLRGEIPIPDTKQPLDAGFYLLPEQLLDEYAAQRESSQLGRILSATKALMAEVDRVVVLGIGGSYMGARALMDACCQPYYNELGRGQRGSRPRIYFEGNNVDNDASQGLLHLLGADRDRRVCGVEEAWGIVVISKSGGTLETATAFRQFLTALEKSCGGDPATVRRAEEAILAALYRLSPVVGRDGSGAFFLSLAGTERVRAYLSRSRRGRRQVFGPVGGRIGPGRIDGLEHHAVARGGASHERAFPHGARGREYRVAIHGRQSSAGAEARGHDSLLERLEQGLGGGRPVV